MGVQVQFKQIPSAAWTSGAPVAGEAMEVLLGMDICGVMAQITEGTMGGSVDLVAKLQGTNIPADSSSPDDGPSTVDTDWVDVNDGVVQTNLTDAQPTQWLGNASTQLLTVGHFRWIRATVAAGTGTPGEDLTVEFWLKTDAVS